MNLDFLILTHRLSPPRTRHKALPDHKAWLAALPDREVGGSAAAGHHTLPFSIFPHTAHTHTCEQCSADGKAVDGRDQSRSRLVWLLVYQRFLLSGICTEHIWGGPATGQTFLVFGVSTGVFFYNAIRAWWCLVYN